MREEGVVPFMEIIARSRPDLVQCPVVRRESTTDNGYGH